MSGVLVGRTALVTGGGQGLGLEIARSFIREGASVAICGRDRGTLDAAQGELQGLAADGQQVMAEVADVSSPDDVGRLTTNVLSTFPDLQILVNNAGIYGPKGNLEDVDWDEWRRGIEINLFGSMLMLRALVPHFRAQGYGKIIQLSGGGATNPLPGLSSYAASKASVVRLAETAAEELRGTGVDINSIAPGALNTRMLDEVLEAGPDAVGQEFYDRAIKQRDSGGAGLERGANLSVYLASAASDGVTAKLISALWDPWLSFEDHLDQLNGSDIYTLRRIVPAERGMTWGD